MATTTINGLPTLVTSLAANDLLTAWRVSQGDMVKITKANALGGVLTGGGTVVTGGNTLTVAGTSSINGTLSAPGFTLTVPATGTAVLLGGTQTLTGLKTFSALTTFSAGVSFGNEALDVYDYDAWTPNDQSGAGLTFVSPSGIFTRIGRLVFATFELDFPATASTADIQLGGLPYTPIVVAGSQAGGGFVFSTTYTTGALRLLVSASKIYVVPVSGVPLTNVDMTSKTLRGTVVYMTSAAAL